MPTGSSVAFPSGADSSRPGRAALVIAQRAAELHELELVVAGYFPRLGGSPRRRSLRRGLYALLQARAHRAISRRFLERAAGRPRESRRVRGVGCDRPGLAGARARLRGGRGLSPSASRRERVHVGSCRRRRRRLAARAPPWGTSWSIVHSLGTSDFEHVDRLAADNVATAAGPRVHAGSSTSVASAAGRKPTRGICGAGTRRRRVSLSVPSR